MTQDGAARVLRISKRTFIRWENDETKPRESQFQLIKDKTGIVLGLYIPRTGRVYTFNYDNLLLLSGAGHSSLFPRS